MPQDLPILYSYYRSSCAWRVRCALIVKNIKYEYRAVNLLKAEQVDEEFKKLNPMGQLPALVVNGSTLTQSIAIMEYLEDRYPDIPLLPKDLALRAKVREICCIISSGIQPLQNLSVLNRIGDEGKEKWAHDFIKKGFVALEKILSRCSGKYCVGDKITMADCCLVPQVYNAKRFKVDMSDFLNINEVNENLEFVFADAHPEKQPDFPVSAS